VICPHSLSSERVGPHSLIRLDCLHPTLSSDKTGVNRDSLDSGIHRGLVFLGEMELVLLLNTRAGVALTKGLEWGPVLCQLLRETPLGRS
jgi:hypothetical protein